MNSRQKYAPIILGSFSITLAVAAGTDASGHRWSNFGVELGASIIAFLLAWLMTGAPSDEELAKDRAKIDKRIARLQARRP